MNHQWICRGITWYNSLWLTHTGKSTPWSHGKEAFQMQTHRFKQIQISSPSNLDCQTLVASISGVNTRNNHVNKLQKNWTTKLYINNIPSVCNAPTFSQHNPIKSYKTTSRQRFWEMLKSTKLQGAFIIMNPGLRWRTIKTLVTTLVNVWIYVWMWRQKLPWKIQTYFDTPLILQIPQRGFMPAADACQAAQAGSQEHQGH